jgi:DNA (cytosine-5)-methyltransferase 1
VNLDAIPIIDLFAGPGGLGEGFSAHSASAHPAGRFEIRLSIEKDPHAHNTLLQRTFLRQLRQG